MGALEIPIETIRLDSGLTLEDDWFALGYLDADTLAIGEPAYHQCNWSYLILDGDQGLLWDTGSGRRPIAPLVARYGGARIAAFPSHMHYDHLGGIEEFDRVMLSDLPILRAFEKNGWVQPSEQVFLGAFEGLAAPCFAVSQWVAPGTVIQIGQRQLEVLHTPGHSPDSVSLWEAERSRFYAADFIYPGELYAQVPGASLPDYAQVLRYLLTFLPADVQILCAHGQEIAGVHGIPTRSYRDLERLLDGIETLLRGDPTTGHLPLSDQMSLIYSEESFQR